MKKLNKMISILITAAMLITSMGMMATVMAAEATDAETASNLLFELDLSDGTIKDSTGNTDIETSENAPQVKTDEAGYSYMSFDQAAKNYIGITAKEDGASLLNNKETTVEFWYRAPSTGIERNKYFHVFTLGDSNEGTTKSTLRMEAYNYNGPQMYTIRAYQHGSTAENDGVAKGTIYSKYTSFPVPEEWHHFVITRVFTNYDNQVKDDDGNVTAAHDQSKAAFSIYKDGVLVTTYAAAGNPDEYGVNRGKDSGYVQYMESAVENKYTVADYDNAKFWFGGWDKNIADNEFTSGDITGIKIYNKVLSFREATASYNASVDTLKNSKTFDENHLLFDMNIENNDGAPKLSDKKGYAYVEKGWGVETLKHAGTFTSEGNTESVDYIDFRSKASYSEGEYLTIGSGQNVSPVAFQNDIAVEMWLKLDDLYARTSTKDSNGNYGYVYPKFFNLSFNGNRSLTFEFGHDDGGMMNLIYGKTTSNGYEATANDSFRVKNIANIINNKWVHFAASRSYDNETGKTTFKTYLNGEKVIDKTVSTIAPLKFNALNIGTGYWWMNSETDRFDGQISKVKVYNKAFTDKLVTEKYNEDLALYRTADEMMGIFQNQAVVSADPETYNGSTFSWTNWQNGTKIPTESFKNKLGETVKYFDFSDSANQYFGVGNSQVTAREAVINQPKLSVEAWVKVDDLLKDSDAFHRIFHTCTNYSSGLNGNGWALIVKGGKLCQYNYGTQMGEGIDLTDYKGDFVHVVITRDIDAEAKTVTYQTYFNGELKDSGTKTSVDDSLLTYPDGNNWQSNQSKQSWFIGDNHWDSNATHNFTGGIGEFRVYQSIVDTATVAKLYNYEKDDYAIDRKMEVTNVEFIDSDESTTISDLSELTGNVVYADVYLSNTTKESKKAFVAFAIYNGDVLDKIEVAPITELGAGLSDTVSFTIENVTVNANSTAKVFIWSADEGSYMTPCQVNDGVVTELVYTAAQEGA